MAEKAVGGPLINHRGNWDPGTQWIEVYEQAKNIKFAITGTGTNKGIFAIFYNLFLAILRNLKMQERKSKIFIDFPRKGLTFQNFQGQILTFQVFQAWVLDFCFSRTFQVFQYQYESWVKDLLVALTRGNL